MSRYTVMDDQGVPVDYGFDPPLSEYFMQHGTQWVVGPLADTHGSNNALGEALTRAGVWKKIPKEHRSAISDDLPF